MRSKLNLRGSSDRHTAAPHLSMSSMPPEWLDAGSWRLPSGKALAEFALQAGFLAPLLLKSDRFGSSPHTAAVPQSISKENLAGSKHFSKGGHS